MSTEEPWDQKEAEPDEEEPGGGDRGPEVQAASEELAPEMMMEEEEESPVPKVPPTQPDAPRKEHINVVFIGHVGQFKHLLTCVSSDVHIYTICLFRSNILLRMTLATLNRTRYVLECFHKCLW